MEVVFDVPLSPPPTYGHDSILWSLGLYTHTLDEALKRGCADDQGPKDFLLRTSSSVTAAVHNYAQAIASDIIKSATSLSAGDMKSEEVLSPMCYTEASCSSASHCFSDPNANVLWGDDQECKTSNYTDEEKLAEYLASMIIRMALKEVAKHDRSSARSIEQSMDHHAHHSMHAYDERVFSECRQILEVSDENMNTQWDESMFEQPASSRARGGSCTSCIYGSLLSQASLTSNQSLDYPDAPPSTPLVPRVTQSRASFCRKLKGGLAKEFLPSPPPPTPNRNPNPSHQLQRGYKETAEDAAEFVDRLMRSLSLECSEDVDSGDIAKGLSTQRPWANWPELSDYADQLSAGIIKYVTTSDEGDDFVDELMWSLSLEHPECIEDTLFKENDRRPQKKMCNVSIALNDFAEQLVNDIIGCAIAIYPSQIDTHKAGHALEESLLPIAERWAEEILKASYREIVNPEGAEDINTLAKPDPWSAKSERVLPSSDMGVEASAWSQIHRPTSVVPSLQRTSESQGDDPVGAGSLRGLAGALLATAFMQALPELRRAVLHPGTGPVALGPPDLYTSGSHRSSLHPSKRMQASLSNGNPGQSTGVLVQANDVANCALHSYAENFALEVIDGAVKLASKYLLGDGKTCSLWLSDGDVAQRCQGPVVRASLGHQTCVTTNELKGALVWAAASQLGIQTLTLAMPDHQLRAQVSGLEDVSL